MNFLMVVWLIEINLVRFSVVFTEEIARKYINKAEIFIDEVEALL